jgi:hypothetical protein
VQRDLYLRLLAAFSADILRLEGEAKGAPLVKAEPQDCPEVLTIREPPDEDDEE